MAREALRTACVVFAATASTTELRRLLPMALGCACKAQQPVSGFPLAARLEWCVGLELLLAWESPRPSDVSDHKGCLAWCLLDDCVSEGTKERMLTRLPLLSYALLLRPGLSIGAALPRRPAHAACTSLTEMLYAAHASIERDTTDTGTSCSIAQATESSASCRASRALQYLALRCYRHSLGRH